MSQVSVVYVYVYLCWSMGVCYHVCECVLVLVRVQEFVLYGVYCVGCILIMMVFVLGILFTCSMETLRVNWLQLNSLKIIAAVCHRTRCWVQFGTGGGGGGGRVQKPSVPYAILGP